MPDFTGGELDDMPHSPFFKEKEQTNIFFYVVLGGFLSDLGTWCAAW